MPKFILCLCLLISGCTTQVHLITQGFNEEQQADLERKIKLAGFKVKNASIAMPNHYPNTVIALNPAHSRTQDIPNLQQLVQQLQLDTAEILRFGANKHFYNNGHIGLYLRHPDTNLNTQMPPYIESANCASGYATLGFSANQTMHLETGIETNGEQALVTAHGHWSFDGSLLTISLPKQPQATFKKSQKTQETYLGARPSYVYTPQQQDHKTVALNCHFEVIFMNK